jgi:protein O-GlcNAc transferase
MEARESIALALRSQGSADWATAARILAQALDRQPSNPDLLFHLAVVRRREGRVGEALDLLTRARKSAPGRADIHYVIGNCLAALDRLEDASASYRQALAASPAFPDAANNLGVVLARLGRPDEAVAAYRRALSLKPGFGGAHHNLAKVLAQLQRHDEAIRHYRDAIAIDPANAALHFDLATSHAALEQWEAALLCYERAVASDPGHAVAHHDRGVALQKVARLDAAIASYRRALAITPDHPVFLNDLGHALLYAHRLDEAADVLCRLLRLRPRDAQATLLLAEGLSRSGRLDAAADIVRDAIAAAPAHAELRFMAGLIEVRRGRLDAGIAAFRDTLTVDAGHQGAQDELLFLLQSTLDWPAAEALAPVVRAATDAALAGGRVCAEKPFESLVRDAEPRRNRRVAEAHARRLAVAPLAPRAPAIVRSVTSEMRKLRLGYLSADFGNHPVAQVMAPVLAGHDRTRFDVTAYGYGHDESSVWRHRIEAATDRLVDLRGLGDHEAAQRIRDDGIDILVDLMVWTANARIRIPLLRPAPLQLQYLGYPGTSGADAFDYAIVDRVVVPDEARAAWSERLILMPHCYFLVDGGQAIASTGIGRADCGLPEEGLVLCSFNQAFKIDRGVFAAWLRILAALPGSVLWLAQLNHAATQRLRSGAVEAGIAPERLIFAPRIAEKSQHLERLQLADLALDTLAYNGHTTTADALVAGVLVVAHRGHHFPSRVSASMLCAAGLDELIAGDVDAYVRLAVRLGQDAAERVRLRARLRAARHSAPLFDLKRGIADLERGFELLWRHSCDGALPPQIHL